MSRLTTEERTKVVMWYYENRRSIVKTQRAFKMNFDRRSAPTPRTIREIVKRFEESGSVDERSRPGPSMTIRTPLNIEKVKGQLAVSPHRSSRVLSRKLKISRSSVRRILVDDLNLFPYKIQILQEQTKEQKKKRLLFAKSMAEKIEERTLDISKVHWTDEAHFHLSGHVNKQNMRIWADAQPNAFTDKPLSREKVTVWCAVTNKRIIGPYFFEDAAGSPLTVNSERYLAMLKKYYIPALRRHREQDQIIFQQDGAPPHAANIVVNWLEEMFNDRVISRRCDNFWPPYSPDLNPCDFYLWGYLKSRVYSDPIPKTCEELKKNIRRELRRINVDTLGKVTENVLVRLQKVIVLRGGWIEHIINS